MTAKTIDRYLKVKALAEGGEPNERDVAASMLKQLEKRYPGVKEAAASEQRRREQKRRAPDPFPGGRPAYRKKAPPARGRARRAGNWENIFSYAAAFYQTVNDVAETVNHALYGKELADREVEVKGYSRAKALFIRVRIPVEAAEKARGLNSMQKEAFRASVREQVEVYLSTMLEG